MATEKGIEPS